MGAYVEYAKSGAPGSSDPSCHRRCKSRPPCAARASVPTRLSQPIPHRISPHMRTTIAPLALALALAAPATAQTTRKPPPEKAAAAANGPKELGKFDDWIAATHQESGQTTCYAFVRSSHSA